MKKLETEKLLKYGRVLNVTGDLSYYFVITIIIFNLNNSPLYMGLLTLSYLIPGFIAKKVNKFDNNFHLKMVQADILRACCLFLMIVFQSNIIILITLVFTEQLFSIPSNTNFSILVSKNIKKEQLNNFNNSINVSSNIFRLIILFIFINYGSKNEIFFIFFDLILTVIAIIMLNKVKSNNNVEIKKENSQSAELKIVENKIIEKILIGYLIVLTLRTALDSFLINFAQEKFNDKATTYFTIYSILTAVSYFGVSYIINKYKYPIQKKNNSFKVSTMMIITFTIFIFQSNLIISYILVALNLLVFAFYETKINIYMQTKSGKQINHFYNQFNFGLSIQGSFNALFGGVASGIIKTSNYYLILAVMTFIYVIYYYKKLK